MQAFTQVKVTRSMCQLQPGERHRQRGLSCDQLSVFAHWTGQVTQGTTSGVKRRCKADQVLLLNLTGFSSPLLKAVSELGKVTHVILVASFETCRPRCPLSHPSTGMLVVKLVFRERLFEGQFNSLSSIQDADKTRPFPKVSTATTL